MPELQHFRRTPDLDWNEVWTAFDRDGGLVVEDFLSEDLLGRLRDEVAP